LCAGLVQVLTEQEKAGNFQWVQRYATALLGSCRRATPTQQQLCNRAQLHLLAFSARIRMGKPGSITNIEQKHIFSAWPNSVNAWSLFSRCGNQPRSLRAGPRSATAFI
jgi:hypothetical protein